MTPGMVNASDKCSQVSGGAHSPLGDLHIIPENSTAPVSAVLHVDSCSLPWLKAAPACIMGPQISMDHLGDVLTVLIVSVFYKENSQKVQVHSKPSLRFSSTSILTGFRSLEHPKALKHLLAILPHRVSSHTFDPKLTSTCWPGTHSPPFSFFFRSKLPVINPGLWRPTPSLLWHLGQAGTLVLRGGHTCSPFTLYPALIRLAFQDISP